jgi:16S rRNA (guanine966-N2)-methyltransferase
VPRPPAPRRPRLRVIAGDAGGRRLVAPPDVRPTADRVREALFASLGGAVPGARVLDLYAGSGALAVEALSRGADRAVLVERDRAAVDACRHNLDVTGLAARARVHAGPVARFLAAGPPAAAPFDLVLIDAPYDAAPDELPAVLAALAEPGWVAADARVVVETARRRPVPAPPPGWAVRDERRYGDTLLTTLGPAPRR